jgi:hypothetical protein
VGAQRSEMTSCPGAGAQSQLRGALAGNEHEIVGDDIDAEGPEDEDDGDPELPVGVGGAPVGLGRVLILVVVVRRFWLRHRCIMRGCGRKG